MHRRTKTTTPMTMMMVDKNTREREKMAAESTTMFFLNINSKYNGKATAVGKSKVYQLVQEIFARDI